MMKFSCAESEHKQNSKLAKKTPADARNDILPNLITARV